MPTKINSLIILLEGEFVKKEKKPPKVKISKWGRIPKNAAKIILSFSHFSAKYSNSKASPFGVRLDPGQKPLDIPYVCLQTMDIGSIPLDYIGGAKEAPLLNQTIFCDALIKGIEPKEVFSDVSREDFDQIRDLLTVLESSSYETDSDRVEERLRQIIVIPESGDPVVLTPLHSPGFSKVLENRLEEEWISGQDSIPPMIPRKKAFLGIGGSKIQNVGRYAHSAQNVLFFEGPVENQEIRRIYSVALSGLKISPSIVGEFYKWRKRVLSVHGSMPGDLKHRQIEKSFLHRIVDDLERQAVRSGNLAEGYLPRLRPEFGEAIRADPWFDHSLRTINWAKTEAEAICGEILSLGPLGEETDETPFAVVSAEDSAKWIGMIVEEIR